DGSDGSCLFDRRHAGSEARSRRRCPLPAARTDYVDLAAGQPRETFCCHLCRDNCATPRGDPDAWKPEFSSGRVRIISSLWPERGDRGCGERLAKWLHSRRSACCCLRALSNAAFLWPAWLYVYERWREPRSHGAMMFLKLLLLFCGLSYSVQELQDVRSVKFVAGITKTTIMMDVIPFLIVNAFFLASFGILIVCLLFPSGHTYVQGNNYENPTRSEMLSTGSYITEVALCSAHFGEFGMDWLRQCQRDPPNSGQESERNCPHPLGNKIYTRAVLFVYLLIISIVLINVLIAKLSLTVGKEDERARVIWRSFRAQLLA
uniref:Ion_trans domain-containing protein n=1 Tax=Macrostomum lignano TaxID=282301 RepID=A0A1I8F2J7_9PLAT